MKYITVKIDLSSVNTWDDFHDLFATTLGFPDYYGRNMDAWIDCMTYLDDADAGMTTIPVKPGEMVLLQLEGLEKLRERDSDVANELLDCAVFVNRRRIDVGDEPLLIISC